MEKKDHKEILIEKDITIYYNFIENIQVGDFTKEQPPIIEVKRYEKVAERLDVDEEEYLYSFQ